MFFGGLDFGPKRNLAGVLRRKAGRFYGEVLGCGFLAAFSLVKVHE